MADPRPLPYPVSQTQGKASYHTRRSSKRNSLENVRCTTHTPVDKQLKLVVGKVQTTSLLQLHDNLHKNFEARAGKVQLTTAVIGEDDASQPYIIGLECVFPTLHAFQDQWH